MYEDKVFEDAGIYQSINDSGSFRNFFRLSSTDFEVLLTKVASHIAKQDTNLRKAITPEDRLAGTFPILATGDSYRSLAYMLKMSKQSISLIVLNVCSAITNSLKDYVKVSTRYFVNYPFSHMKALCNCYFPIIFS